LELLGGSLAGDFMVAEVVLLLLLYEGANNWRGDCCRFICCPSFEVSLLVLTCALLGFLWAFWMPPPLQETTSQIHTITSILHTTPAIFKKKRISPKWILMLTKKKKS
jgi:hypothetical protein